MQITRAFKSRVILSKEQQAKAFANAGVRKFAFNDFLYRSEYHYAKEMLYGNKPIKNIFSLYKIANILNVSAKYYLCEKQNEWIFKLIDPEKNSIELKISVHGKQEINGKSHPKPDAGLAWLKERIKFLKEEPLSPKAGLKDCRARYPWIEETSSIAYREAMADARDAFDGFYKKGNGFPKYDIGTNVRFRFEPGGAEKLGEMFLVETIDGALQRLNGNYVEFVKADKKFFVYKNKAIEVRDSEIKVPHLGWVKLCRKGYFPTRNCKYSGVAFTYKAGHWYVSLTVSHLNVKDPKPRNDEVIGIDVGSRYLMTDSNGKTYGKNRNLKREKKLERKIARLNRAMIRRVGKIKITDNGAVARDADGKKIKQKPSKRYLQTKLELQKAHEKLGNMRQDLLHKASRRVIDRGASTYRVEDLAVQDMIAKLPGAKAHDKRLRKINAKVGYYSLRSKIEYKAKWAGAEVIPHEAHYTSKQCSKCGSINYKLGSKEYFKCEECGFGITFGKEKPAGSDLPENHRDFNAAMTHRDPEKYSDKRDLAWSERTARKKVPARSGEPAQ